MTTEVACRPYPHWAKELGRKTKERKKKERKKKTWRKSNDLRTTAGYRRTGHIVMQLLAHTSARNLTAMSNQPRATSALPHGRVSEHVRNEVFGKKDICRE
jgi:hypothetical protein